MKKYEIITKTIYTGETKHVIQNNKSASGKPAFFAGYNFMGGVDWDTDILGAYYMDREEADQIKSDLEAADEPAENPADKQYLFKSSIEDEKFISIKTGREIAEIYEMDQIAGIYGDMEVWDVSGEPKRISLLDLVEPILDNKRWMEQEYRDYCENERYGY